MEIEPLTPSDRTTLVEAVEAMLDQPPAAAGVQQRLACLLEPNVTSSQVRGAGRMLSRLRRFDAALERCAVTGFRAVASAGERHRVGNVEPAQFHRTLHQYAVASPAAAEPETLARLARSNGVPSY